MPKVVGITFDGNHKKYYFGAIDNLLCGDRVVVETIRGLELGKVIEKEKEISDEEVIGELKKVLRKATDEDVLNNENNKLEIPSVLKSVRECVKTENLNMKVLDCEYTLDKTKLLIYFTSEQRVDFRELVKELARQFKTRIELRQIGPRDASKLVGGIGSCGNAICCSTFLGDVQNVSIKMAKNQNLALNPTTISGLCGKLLCCIAYEDKIYTDLKEKFPGVGDTITTEKGDGVVVSVDILKEIIKVKYQDGKEENHKASEFIEE